MVICVDKMILSPYSVENYIIRNLYKNMSKKITFTLKERVDTIGILNAYKGELSGLAKVLDDIKKVAITPAEWEKAKLVKTPAKNENGDPIETWNWEDKKENEKEIELDTDVIDYIKAQIKHKEDKKEVTMSDVALITLKAKL